MCSRPKWLLPDLVQAVIAGYLSMNDVRSLSASSRSMQGAIDQLITQVAWFSGQPVAPAPVLHRLLMRFRALQLLSTSVLALGRCLGHSESNGGWPRSGCLERLHLTFDPGDCEGIICNSIELVGRYLQSLPRLHELDVDIPGEMAWRDGVIAAFVDFLRQRPSVPLHKVTIQGLTPDLLGRAALAEALQSRGELRILSIDWVGDAGDVEFLRALLLTDARSGLEELELAGAMQEPHAAVVTLFLRQHGHPLRSLTLDFTEGVDASELIMALADGSRAPVLERLVLYGCGLPGPVLVALLDYLSRCEPLVELRLMRVGLSTDDLRTLLTTLGTHTCRLRVLGLHGLRDGEGTVEVLREVLWGSATCPLPRLQVLDLSEAVGGALPLLLECWEGVDWTRPCQLREVNVRGCGMTPELRQRFRHIEAQGGPRAQALNEP